MVCKADGLNGHIPVSYTHLDVYKRQLEELTDLGFNTKGGKVLYIGNSSLIDEDLTPSISIGYEYGAKAVYRFYGDVFNLKTGTAQVNEHLFDVNVSAFAYKKWDAKISLNLLPEKIISFIR